MDDADIAGVDDDVIVPKPRVHHHNLRPMPGPDKEQHHDAARNDDQHHADHEYNLRPRPPNYGQHIHCNIMETVLTQYSVKKG